ncbi:MAG: DUF1834 family protein [Caulobacter sp.]|nr:DUF1834 family protein [Caulobacter sp.]
MIVFAAIENAMIARLEAASEAGILGYAIRTVDSLPADLDERLPHYVQQYPAAWTVFNGWRAIEEQGDGTTLVEARYAVVVACANLRNERSQRHGAGGEVGSYQLVADVAALLSQQTFGLPIGHLVLGDCSSLYTSSGQAERKASLYAVNFSSRLVLDPAAPPLIQTPAIGDFETFQVGWDLPPHTGTPDLSDTHTLPQEP